MYLNHANIYCSIFTEKFDDFEKLPNRMKIAHLGVKSKRIGLWLSIIVCELSTATAKSRWIANESSKLES